LGVVLSILLSFRTNSAYDRWWEGRKKWGELVNNSRNLAVYLHSCLPQDDDESRHYLAVRIANFAIALKEHLRSGAQTDEFIMVSAEEIKQYNRKAHIPNFIAYEIVQHIQDAYRAGHLSTADHINIKQHSQELLNIAGACERIKKTFCIDSRIRILVSAHCSFCFLCVYRFGVDGRRDRRPIRTGLQ
jgi:putative membrane protein